MILGQIILANNSPPDLDNYVLEENEVRLHVPLYNTESGLAFIMTQETRMRFFFPMDMMKRDQKFCIQTLNTHFQIYFKVLPSRNMPKC